MNTFNEIERKYLLKRFPKFKDISNMNNLKITQWYHPDGFRYRYQVELPTGNITIFKTLKTSISPGVNEEQETILTQEEFEKLDLSNSPKVEKIRTVVKDGKHKFEFDRYVGMNLVTMEIELDDLNEHIDIPTNISKEIICEVTNIKELSNRNLSEL